MNFVHFQLAESTNNTTKNMNKHAHTILINSESLMSYTLFFVVYLQFIIPVEITSFLINLYLFNFRLLQFMNGSVLYERKL